MTADYLYVGNNAVDNLLLGRGKLGTCSHRLIAKGNAPILLGITVFLSTSLRYLYTENLRVIHGFC
jgi:hypothetical protein